MLEGTNNDLLYFTDRDVSRVAAFFLIMDQNDPEVDYNDEAQPRPDTNIYRNEALDFLGTLDYLIEGLAVCQTEEAVTKLVFDSARIFDSNVSKFFVRIYQVLMNSNSGAKLPALISILGHAEFTKLVLRRVEKLV